jgi:HSP20 family protein
MSTMFEPFDQLMSGLLGTTRSPRPMPVDLFRDGDQYVLSADLPGIDPDSIEIQLDGRMLMIRAERPLPAGEGIAWLAHERSHGLFERHFTLGEGADADRITAAYDQGVLSVIIPLAEKARPRKITLGGTAPEVITQSKAVNA